MKRIYKNSDIEFKLSDYGFSFDLNMIDAVTFKFFTNKVDYITKNKNDIEDGIIFLDGKDLNLLSEGILYYGYEIENTDKRAIDNKLNKIDEIITDYYIKNGNTEDVPVEKDNYYTKLQTDTKLVDKQDKLVSGKNIATINNQDITKGGNITIEGGDTSKLATKAELNTKADKSELVGKKTIQKGEVFNWESTDDYPNLALGSKSHSEGCSTIAYGWGSHAEGLGEVPLDETLIDLNTATLEEIEAYYDGEHSIAYEQGSHIEGWNGLTLGDYSHAEGCSCMTRNLGEHAEGQWNNSQKDGLNAQIGYSTISSIGVGEWNQRKNAIEVMIDTDINDDGSAHRSKVFIDGIGNYDGTCVDYTDDIATVINNKQDKLVNGVNIATVCGYNLTEGGNLTFLASDIGYKDTGGEAVDEVLERLEANTNNLSTTKQDKLVNGQNISSICGYDLTEGGNKELTGSDLYWEDGSEFTIEEQFDIVDFKKADKLEQIIPTSNILTLSADKYYKWGEVTELKVTYTGVEEAIFEFKSGVTPTKLMLSDNVKWINNKPLIPEANKTYVVSILNSLAIGGAI